MKQTILLILLLVCLSGVAFGQENIPEDRHATIKDKVGVSTDIFGITYAFTDYPNAFKNIRRHVAVITKNYEVTIPFNAITSISINGEIAEIKYRDQGSDKTVAGKLRAGVFIGKSSFGHLELRSDKLVELNFVEPPSANAESPVISQLAMISLNDGSKISVTNPQIRLRRTSSFKDKGISFERIDKDNFEFMLGESIVTIELKNTQSLGFGPNRTVTVNLTNGQNATGRLTADRDELVGFTGYLDEGEVFVSIDQVKNVEFKEPQK